MKFLGTLVFLSFCCISSVAGNDIKSVRVFVALCDNENQGIVPVPAKLGNGDDPANNLYWGALYGVKGFLSRSKNWVLISHKKNATGNILEELVLKHKSSNKFMEVRAYRGTAIKRAIQDFFKAFDEKDKTRIVVYIGHNGLMDFRLKEPPQKAESDKTAIVLCCKSKQYFAPYLSRVGAKQALLTTNFMAPEAYVLDAAVRSLLLDGSLETSRRCAALAYSRYQKCGKRAANRLFTTISNTNRASAVK